VTVREETVFLSRVGLGWGVHDEHGKAEHGQSPQGETVQTLYFFFSLRARIEEWRECGGQWGKVPTILPTRAG